MRSSALSLCGFILSLGFGFGLQSFSVLAEQGDKVSPEESMSTASNVFSKQVDRDVEAFQKFFIKRFPRVEFSDYQNGVYALDQASREQWLEIEEFPPYEFDIDHGKSLFDTPFANGKTYADCFENGGLGIRQNYPLFNEELGEVITLELAINRCRQQHGESPLPYKKGDLAAISAYMASTSTGQIFNTLVDSEAAYKAYNQGKKFFYSKRGQLNFSCSDCHMQVSGLKLRADVLGPSLGQVTGFPVFRSKWTELGTLHRRYAGCNANVRAKPFAAQSLEYRNLEYFQSVMSRGLEVNGPSSRK